MKEGAERVVFSHEMVNVFVTITSNGRGCTFTSKSKSNPNKCSVYNQFLKRKWYYLFVCVHLCKLWSVQGKKQCRKSARLYTSVYTSCKDRQTGRKTNWT